MSNIQAISRDRHLNTRWKPRLSYLFAAHDSIAPIVVQEIPKAATSLPIGFILKNEEFMPVAIQGLEPNKNLFVAPNGRWIEAYTPGVYRGYPFLLANTEDGKQVLCLDEASDLISETEGEDFFKEGGQPSEAINAVMEFLTRIAQNRDLTARICAALDKYKLIQPWPIKVQTDSGEQNIEGLYRIDETALNELSAKDFASLRKSGAIPVVYCQLISMNHLPKLGILHQAHAQIALNKPSPLLAGKEPESLNIRDLLSF